MKTTGTLIASLAGLASVAYAQNGVPACGQPCITPYISGSSIAGCASLDVACICSNSLFLSGISCCLESSCDAADQQTAVDFALNLCEANGVTNLPTAVSVLCTSSVTFTGSSGVATSTPASVTTTASGSVSTGSSASVASKSSSASATTKSASSTGSSSSTSTAAAKTGAAAHNVAGMGAGIMGGLAGLAVFL